MPSESWEQIETQSTIERAQRRSLFLTVALILIAAVFAYVAGRKSAAKEAASRNDAAQWASDREVLYTSYTGEVAAAKKGDAFAHELFFEESTQVLVKLENEARTIQDIDHASRAVFVAEARSCALVTMTALQQHDAEADAHCRALLIPPGAVRVNR